MGLTASEITAAVVARCRETYNMSDTRIICEFPLGDVRADVLVVFEQSLVVYEIKGEGDSFGERWKRQCQWYWHFAGNVVVVYAESLAAQAKKALNDHGSSYVQWAHEVEAREGGSGIELSSWPKFTPAPWYTHGKGDLDPCWRLAAMWREEVIDLALHHGIPLKRSATKTAAVDILIKALPAPAIHRGFIHALKTRDYESNSIWDRSGYISPPLKIERSAKTLFETPAVTTAKE